MQTPERSREATTGPTSELIRLDIACGLRKQDGYVGIDISPDSQADILHDLESYPWPIESDSVTDAFCSHYLEHTTDLIAFMEELYRILAVGGKCVIDAPYYTSMRAWQDPTHTRAISEATFFYFDKDWRIEQKLEQYPISCDFGCEFGYVVHDDWAGKSQEELEFALRHYWNVAADIHAVLTKR